MFAIETELGRFEADTEKDAKRLLRAAQRKQAAIDASENEIRTLAHLRACKAAYFIYERKGRGEEMPRGWRVKPVSECSYCCRTIYKDGHRHYQIETEQGIAVVDPYDDITHCVENGAGFCMAVSIANQDCELFAVGVNEERAAWVAMPGVSRDEFPFTTGRQ